MIRAQRDKPRSRELEWRGGHQPGAGKPLPPPIKVRVIIRPFPSPTSSPPSGSRKGICPLPLLDRPTDAKALSHSVASHVPQALESCFKPSQVPCSCQNPRKGEMKCITFFPLLWALIRPHSRPLQRSWHSRGRPATTIPLNCALPPKIRY